MHCKYNMCPMNVVDMIVNPPIACFRHTMCMVNASIPGICFKHVRLMCSYLHEHMGLYTDCGLVRVARPFSFLFSVGFVCVVFLRPLSCVHNFASASVLPIRDCLLLFSNVYFLVFNILLY